MVRTVSTMKHR